MRRPAAEAEADRVRQENDARAALAVAMQTGCDSSNELRLRRTEAARLKAKSTADSRW